MPEPTTPRAGDGALLTAVRALRAEIEAARLPLELPETVAAVRIRKELLDQFDDYLIPRLESVDAPLLAVVGGSTGAGKSTLVNSLVGEPVTAPGVLRPTTREPVLVHHSSDARWFTDRRILPSLERVSRGGADPNRSRDETSPVGVVRLVTRDSLQPGLALVDAPDIDSVVTANRELASQLLAAADLWLFVTTAARYADAVPWALLHKAQERGTAVAVVLDRVPANAVTEVRDHLASMLAEHGLGDAPVFTIVERSLDQRGLLPASETERLSHWLGALARDAKARSVVVRQTLTGTLGSLQQRTAVLSEASRRQVRATFALTDEVDTEYAKALTAVDEGMADGTLLRGEVLARWQEYVGSGEFFKQIESTVARLRDRVAAAVKGEPAPGHHLGEALHSGVAALVMSQAENAAKGVSRVWRTLPGGEVLLQAHEAVATPPAQLEAEVEALVAQWQSEVLELVRAEGRDRRTTAKIMAYGVNGIGVILMLVAFAHGGSLVGAEIGIAGGSAVVGQKLLEAIFGDQAVRVMASKARTALLERVQQLYAEQAQRYFSAVESVEVRRDQARHLERAALAVQAAR